MFVKMRTTRARKQSINSNPKLVKKMISRLQSKEERTLAGLALSAQMGENLVAGDYCALNAYFIFSNLRILQRPERQPAVAEKGQSRVDE
jgi:hypothetical protein